MNLLNSLLLLTSISKNTPNYYKAIFKNIKTVTYYAQEIAPEMIRYKYKVGHIYTNGEHVGQNPSLSKAEFTVNQDHNIKLVRLSKVISDKDAELLDYEDIKKYFLRQYAHIEEQEDCTLIIPCYTIANRFYLISSSIKHAIMTSTLDELYYNGSFKVERTPTKETIVKIHIKKKAGKKDLPFLCRFIGSSFAKSRLEYLSLQKTLTTHEYQPIKAQFPVKHPFDIYASYVYLGSEPITILHGIYVRRISSKSELEAQIGKIWKREVIDEIIEKKLHNYESYQLLLTSSQIKQAILEE